ncbi:MAG: transposase [Fibrobacterota bacterium]
MAYVSELTTMLPRMECVVACAQKANSGVTVPASERIFSIFEPHTELLMRGKAHKPVEFGLMVSIGQTAEKFISFDRIEAKSQHDIQMGDEALKEHKKQFGEYPQEFAADKNYYGGQEHAAKWRERIRVYSVGKKGRRDVVETKREHGAMFRMLQQFRAGCEGSISTLKRVFGLCRCLYKGFNSFASSVGCTVFSHNLVVLCRQ